MQKIKNDLEMDLAILHKWFHENYMVLNHGRCHYIVIGYDNPSHKIILNNNEIASTNEEKRLGILLDSKLNFDSHILFVKKQSKILVLLQSLPHSRSENLAIKLWMFKRYIKQHSRKSLTFDLRAPF